MIDTQDTAAPDAPTGPGTTAGDGVVAIPVGGDEQQPAPRERTPVELPPAFVELAAAAAAEEAGDERPDPAAVGEHLGAVREDDVAVTVGFAATAKGYRGWVWSVTLAVLPGSDVATVSEVVLVPGDGALIAPPWVPWEQRVRGGDLGVGDLLPTPEDDPRLVPAYLQSDDPAVEEVARELGLGRVRVLSRDGRADAADRWYDGAFGPSDPMAQQAPGRCGQCGFFTPLAGALGGAFGVCANELAPGDGRVVAVDYGCGAHSEAVAPVLAPTGDGDELRVDELTLEIHERTAPPADTAEGPADTAGTAGTAGAETAEASVPEAVAEEVPAVESAGEVLAAEEIPAENPAAAADPEPGGEPVSGAPEQQAGPAEGDDPLAAVLALLPPTAEEQPDEQPADHPADPGA